MAEQKPNTPTQKSLPLDIVGSSTYGRDPKVMASRTFNMINADGWLVDYAGYKKVLDIAPQGSGRGLFNSIRSDRLIVVISNKVYAIAVYATSNGDVRSYTTRLVGTMDSYSGDVFIDENINNQIAICDKHDIYIYNYVTGDFTVATLPVGFIPGYVRYQDGYFIAPDLSSASWALSAINDGLNWFWNAATGGPVLGALQTKADYIKAAFPMPGKGNLLLVMGNLVTELWTNVGGAIFPYQRSFSLNIDYGCVNSATIAASDEVVAWLGSNEKSGPVIMYTTGADIKQISTDGINYRFSQLKNPEKSAGFFVKLSGHLLYQLTFYDPRDNYSLIYDFTEQKFYDVTDEKMDYHIARSVAFFNNEYYFVSLNDGNLYQLSDQFFNFDYGKFLDGSPKVYEIPRVRACSNIRSSNQKRFSINNATFTIEQGSDVQNDGNDPDYFPGIDMSMSKNGGVSYGSYSCRKPLYKVGNRENRLNWWRLGVANDLVLQFRFFGKGPWRSTNGEVNIIQ